MQADPDCATDTPFQQGCPIAFYSAKLSAAERDYPVGEQELLAIGSAPKKWRCHFEGAKGGVTLMTDHLPNT